MNKSVLKIKKKRLFEGFTGEKMLLTYAEKQNLVIFLQKYFHSNSYDKKNNF